MCILKLHKQLCTEEEEERNQPGLVGYIHPPRLHVHNENRVFFRPRET